jgi:imidazole glycerol-phosphate synthase subunit HisH
MSRVVLVDSGGSNIGSVNFALQRVGVEAPLTTDPVLIGQAERVILPGVGAAAPAMQRLRDANLIELLRGLKAPLLGVCVGMQILFDHSEEGDIECLGLIPGVVRRLPAQPGIRIPHMGWNRLEPVRQSGLLDGIEPGAWAYFVHSYGVDPGPHTLATATHGQPFAALVQQGSVSGAQFHPERSASVGARLLENFLR